MNPDNPLDSGPLARALLVQMFEGDLDLAKSAIRSGQTALAKQHLDRAAVKLKQIESLVSSAPSVPQSNIIDLPPC